MRFRTEEKLVESLHFILDAFAAAVRTGDANDVELLFQMTKAKTGLMDDIRHSLQTSKVPADAEYQRRLLELTAQFERSVWLLRRQMGFFSRRYRQ